MYGALTLYGDPFQRPSTNDSTFSRSLHTPYVFRRGSHHMTGAGFPHSDILGSTLGWQLPEAYRSLLRPSSAPGAQASTVCP